MTISSLNSPLSTQGGTQFSILTKTVKTTPKSAVYIKGTCAFPNSSNLRVPRFLDKEATVVPSANNKSRSHRCALFKLFQKNKLSHSTALRSGKAPLSLRHFGSQQHSLPCENNIRTVTLSRANVCIVKLCLAKCAVCIVKLCLAQCALK